MSLTYLQTRLNKLGITNEINQVKLWHDKYPVELAPPDDNGRQAHVQELKPVPIFREHVKGFEIMVYGLGRRLINYKPEDASGNTAKWSKPWSIVRVEKPEEDKNGRDRKYIMPKGNGSYPFFPPALLDKYDNREHIDTLFLTEGYIKAIKASLHGMDIIGLPSITHLKEKSTGGLHADVLAIIAQCTVTRVVWLTDGDCLDISKKALEDTPEALKVDLRTRPFSFFSSIVTFRQLLSNNKDVEKYFMYPAIDAILEKHNFLKALDEKLTRDDIKGLDDLLCSFPGHVDEIVADISRVSDNGFWFNRYNISYSDGKVWDLFALSSATKFFLSLQERKIDFKNRPFVFGGTQYRYNEEKVECEIMVPAEAKDYMRVGNDYYEFFWKPTKDGIPMRVYKGRLKSIIVEDHGKDFCRHVAKYKDFINIPSHTHYQDVIDGCYNMYAPLTVRPLDEQCTEEDCPTIIGFLLHIFGNRNVKCKHPETKKEIEVSHLDMALDYLQLLYTHPTQKLPIVCLVSKDNNTGKTTFLNLLKMIFEANCAIIGNKDLEGDFNQHWACKLIVGVDETYVEKQLIMERIKSLSTAPSMTMNAKNKDHVEIDVFLKFVLLSNNEDNFLPISGEDERFWVHKVQSIGSKKVNIGEQMRDEIPALLQFLSARQLKTECLGRMWFHEALLKTPALAKVQQRSRSTVEREIIEGMRGKFFDFECESIMMTIKDLQEEFFKKKNYEDSYLRTVMEEKFKLLTYHVFLFKGQPYKTQKLAIEAAMQDTSLALTNEFEAMHHIKLDYRNCKYGYPRWGLASALPGQPPQQVREDIKGKLGRPYTFLRENFLTADEIASGSAENNYINEMTVQPGQEIPEGAQEALPF